MESSWSVHDTVILETYDDGRLDRLIDRFTAAAGSNIPPAHPRTKIIGKEQRHLLALSWRWQHSRRSRRRRRRAAQQRADRIHHQRDLARDIASALCAGGHPSRPPQAGDSEIALRAAVLQLKKLREGWVDLVDWDKLRAKLQSSPSLPSIPSTVDIDELPLSRLALIPVDRLDDDRILALYTRAREWGIRRVLNRVARLIDSRPVSLSEGQDRSRRPYTANSHSTPLDAATAPRRSTGSSVAWHPSPPRSGRRMRSAGR